MYLSPIECYWLLPAQEFRNNYFIMDCSKKNLYSHPLLLLFKIYVILSFQLNSSLLQCSSWFSCAILQFLLKSRSKIDSWQKDRKEKKRSTNLIIFHVFVRKSGSILSDFFLFRIGDVTIMQKGKGWCHQWCKNNESYMFHFILN
jgi:hypothetical protein